jgi:hypothetical protein
MRRVLKVLVAGWAMAVGAAIVLIVGSLWISGPQSVDRIFDWKYMSILFVLGVIVAARFLR